MPQFKDLTGKTIGRLTFLENHVVGKKRFWKVKCQCGEKQTYRADYFLKMEKEGVRFECYKCKWERKSPTLTDKIYGRLTVIKEVPSLDNHHRYWLCKCECGVEKTIAAVNLMSKKKTPTRSCGCLARKLNSKWVNTTQYPPAHKLKTKNTEVKRFKLYHCRNAMVSSCYREKDLRYKHHGALGHRVCDLWRNSANDFVKWALENGYEDGSGVFLKDGEYIFSPENCFVMCKKERNKINNSKMVEWNGKIQSITDWAFSLGCSTSCLSTRLKNFKHFGLDKVMNLSWIPERTQKYGTEHFEKDIVNLYLSGKTFIEISKELGCSSSTIGRFLKKNLIKARPAKCRSSLI